MKTPYTAEEASSVIRELQRELVGMRLKAETDQGYIDRKRAVIGVLQGTLERFAALPSNAFIYGDTMIDPRKVAEIARAALAEANVIATARTETP